MSQYFYAVCHDCKAMWTPSSLQLIAIQSCESTLAEIGAFFVEHRHHRIDLIGDNGDDGGCDWAEVRKYREINAEARMDFWTGLARRACPEIENTLKNHLAAALEGDGGPSIDSRPGRDPMEEDRRAAVFLVGMIADETIQKAFREAGKAILIAQRDKRRDGAGKAASRPAAAEGSGTGLNNEPLFGCKTNCGGNQMHSTILNADDALSAKDKVNLMEMAMRRRDVSGPDWEDTFKKMVDLIHARGPRDKTAIPWLSSHLILKMPNGRYVVYDSDRHDFSFINMQLDEIRREILERITARLDSDLFGILLNREREGQIQGNDDPWFMAYVNAHKETHGEQTNDLEELRASGLEV